MEEPLVDRTILLEKYPGKGGWTYAALPGILPDSNTPFGWVKVKGKIDGYVFSQVKLMPMGEGKLFFPVKKEIRKTIGKEAGDSVHILLYLDKDPLLIPAEITACLKDETEAWKHFQAFSEGQQKAYLDWVLSAKTDQTRVNRIVEMINRCKKGLPKIG